VLRRLFSPRWAGLLALALVVENGYLTFPPTRDSALRAEESDAVGGQHIAKTLGCFNCHGPDSFLGFP
jgi:hypothetical protein